MSNLDIAFHNLKVAINGEGEYKKYKGRPTTRDSYLVWSDKKSKLIIKYENR